MNVDLALRGRLSALSHALYKAALGCGDKIALTPALLASASSGQFEWLMDYIRKTVVEREYSATRLSVITGRTSKGGIIFKQPCDIINLQFYSSVITNNKCSLLSTVYDWITTLNNVRDISSFCLEFYTITIQQSLILDNYRVCEHIIFLLISPWYDCRLTTSAKLMIREMLLNGSGFKDELGHDSVFSFGIYRFKFIPIIWTTMMCKSKHAILFIKALVYNSDAFNINDIVYMLYFTVALHAPNIKILKWLEKYVPPRKLYNVLTPSIRQLHDIWKWLINLVEPGKMRDYIASKLE